MRPENLMFELFMLLLAKNKDYFYQFWKIKSNLPKISINSNKSVL